MDDPRIWLCDLTYNQQSIANDTVPAAIGGIAAAISATHKNCKIKLFKFPENLFTELEKQGSHQGPPDIISFSNYSWNVNISTECARRISSVFPEVFFVSGGPNFPFDTKEQHEFLRKRSFLDVYIQKEGEIAWVELVSLWKKSSSVKSFRNSLDQIPNVVFISHEDNLVSSSITRIRNLEELPSPYLNGILDEFLDGSLLPVIQTNRGCPFTCSFCTEGQKIWSLVKRKSPEVLRAELSYISKHFSALPENKKRHDLLIADSNFGMYKEDIDICIEISKIQESTGWPTYINVATGKNNKERVLEASKIVNGAINLAGSVQSLNEKVQKNIKRQNISSDQIISLAKNARLLGADSYSELILALPGESKASHIQAIDTLIDSGFNYVVMYQLMLLPGTEMSSAESINTHKLSTKYRLIPRCFGRYTFNGESFYSFETEQIVVSTSTLSNREYLDCRLYALCVNIFYNNSVFGEVLGLIRILGIPASTWISTIYEEIRKLTTENRSPSNHFGVLDDLVKGFFNETSDELWESEDKLIESFSSPEKFDELLSGISGANLIYKYKALSITSSLSDVRVVAENSFKKMLSAIDVNHITNGRVCDSIDVIQAAAGCLFEHAFRRMDGIFETDSTRSIEVNYPIDMDALLEIIETEEACTLDNLVESTSGASSVSYFHTKDQAAQLESYTSRFGRDSNGISRILTRVFLRQYFKSFRIQNCDHQKNLPVKTFSSAQRPTVDKRLQQS